MDYAHVHDGHRYMLRLDPTTDATVSCTLNGPDAGGWWIEWADGVDCTVQSPI